MLKLKHITKDYVTKLSTVNVLKGISINFRECEFVTILGQSGCGKTTLLNIIGGLDRYTSGDIVINGRSTKDFDDRDWDKYRNKQIGFVFQSYNLIPHLDVLHNVELALTLAGNKKEVRIEKAMEALKKVGLEDQAYKKPNQLSGGQMQRVAIARALVNNPSIILADEPTGALDTESGTMVMELLKEVARDRLVILVSHNAELAKVYSTRTVSLIDGVITTDTDPFIDPEDMEEVIDEVVDESGETVSVTKKITQRFKKSTKQKVQERKEERKVSMNEATTIALSARNLYSKKWRTFLTSFAGSIGIIGLSLVLALSTGVNKYISKTEESALSIYPIKVEKQGSDLSIEDFAKALTQGSGALNNDMRTSKLIFISKVLGNLTAGGGYNMVVENDLTALKVWLDDGNFDDSNGYLRYNYDNAKLHIYSNFVDVQNGNSTEKYIKISPFVDAIESLAGGVGTSLKDTFGTYLNDFVVWDELIGNQNILNQQYDLLDGTSETSRWPTEADECVLVLDKNNQIADYMMFALGLKDPDDVASILTGSSDFYSSFSIDDVLGFEYRVMCTADYYQENGGAWTRLDNFEGAPTFVENNSLPLKVVGIVRPKENATATAIKGGAAYTYKLTEAIIDRAVDSPAVVAQRAQREINEDTGNWEYYNICQTSQSIVDVSATDEITDKTDIKGYVEEYMGVAYIEEPDSISIYASSFEGKDNIIKMFDNYASETGNTVKYTDMLSTLMTYIKKLTDAMLNALIAFSSISLIVSSIMISIITYTSVLERRKEIGVLRSIGARKIDISNMFVTESSIIGLISGVLGIAFGYLLAFIASLILEKVIGIANLMTLNWYFALSLVVISFLLSLVAGVIPSAIAANKDPVQALRSE